MSRLERRFEELRREGRAALIPYIMTGDPKPQGTTDLMHALVRAGADAVELGMPFSDPIADGPVIQGAGERALAAGCRLRHSLEAVSEFREQDRETPVILMGYLNPIEIMGREAFIAQASVAGVDAVLIVDLPPEEAGTLAEDLRAAEMDLVFLVAPTTVPERRERAMSLASGFLYYVSLKGVTGAGGMDVARVRTELAGLREKTALPLGVGFGIGDAETAAAVGEFADAVIVGSALVGQLHEAADRGESPAIAAETFLAPLSRAVRNAAGNKPDNQPDKQEDAAVK